MQKVVFVLGGGGIYGVFGGGALRALERAGVYDHVEAVYATSAGVTNAAYFLARQTEEGSNVYLKDFRSGFFQLRNIIPGILQLACCRIFSDPSRHTILKVLNIDYALDVIQRKRPLDVATIQKSPIPLYARLLNTKNWNIEYFDLRTNDFFSVLKASISIAPYYLGYENIHGQLYTDAGIQDPLGLADILHKYPDHKIVVIMNLPLKRKWWFYVKNSWEGIIASMYGIPPSKTFFIREKVLREDICSATSNERVLFVSPPTNFPVRPWTKDPRILAAGIEMGQAQAKRIIDFVTR